MHKLQQFILYSLLILVAGITRLYNIDLKSFTIDELFTILEVSRYNLDHFIFDYCLNGSLVPLFFLLQRGYLSFFEINEFLFRMPSLMFGLGTCLILFNFIYKYSKGSNYFAYFSFVVFAFLIDQIGLSQFARPYSMLGLFTLIHFILSYKIKERSYSRDYIFLWYCLVSIILFYTHHLGGLYVVVMSFLLNGVFLYQEGFQGSTFKKFFLSSTVVAILYLPWFIFGSYQALTKADWWTPTPSLEYFYTIVGSFFGYYPIYVITSVLVIIWASFVEVDSKEKELQRFSTTVLCLCLCIFSLKSYIGASLYSVKYFSHFSSIAIISLTTSFILLAKKYKYIVIIPVGLATSMIITTTNLLPHWDNERYKEVITEIAEVSRHFIDRYKHKDMVFLSANYNQDTLDYYTNQHEIFRNEVPVIKTGFKVKDRTWCGLSNEKFLKRINKISFRYLWIVNDKNDCSIREHMKDNFKQEYYGIFNIVEFSLWQRVN